MTSEETLLFMQQAVELTTLRQQLAEAQRSLHKRNLEVLTQCGQLEEKEQQLAKHQQLADEHATLVHREEECLNREGELRDMEKQLAASHYEIAMLRELRDEVENLKHERAMLTQDLSAAREQLADLTRQSDETIKALYAKVKALSPHGTCGCSFDTPQDLCLHHSPKLVDVTEERDFFEARLVNPESLMEKEAEIGRLREALETIKRGTCWCGVGIGHPLYTDHSEACKMAKAALAAPSKESRP